MKKLIALLLALIMCVGVFAACGEAKEPASPDTPADKPTEPTDKPEDKPAEPTEPAAPDYSKPGLKEDGKTFVGVLDMTDYYSLVIEKIGQSGDARMPIRAAAGKVQVGSYNAAGKKRNASYELDFSALGVEGHAWEYLGATVVLDVSDAANIKVIKAPEKKTSYCVKLNEITFPNDTTVKMPDGTEFDIASMNWGGLTNKYLLNEGGWYIPGWNDTSIVNASSGMFTKEAFNSGWYFICGCALYNENVMFGGMTYSLHEFPAEAPAA